MLAVRTLLAEKVFEPRDARKREVVFRSQLLSQPTISWVAFAWPDGSFFAGHKAGDGVIEMLEITPDHKLRTNRYEFVGNDLQLKNSYVEDTKYSVTDQEWFRSAYQPGEGQPFNTTVTRDGKAYQAVLTPISFPGWSLVTVVPESEFLGPVRMTIRNLLIGLAVLIVGAGLLSAWLAQRLIAAPLIKVVNEIRHVERFDLDKVQRHPSRLTEISNLSGAIGDMAQGLAAFRKYIPADLVRRLISDGNGARLGGAVRPMSVMFIDLAGFTGMSERLGDRIIPLLSRYFDSVSVQIQNQNGTIDKFIGDAVMAFWGAPSPNPDHAVDCCRAALACRRAVEEAGLVDDHGQPVKIRIGINSGDMLVGNIGSEVRLNYTVIGDAVNIASRLESTNKSYSSTIIIGPATRRLAGDRI